MLDSSGRAMMKGGGVFSREAASFVSLLRADFEAINSIKTAKKNFFNSQVCGSIFSMAMNQKEN